MENTHTTISTEHALSELLVNVDSDYALIAWRRISVNADSFAVVYRRTDRDDRYFLASIDLDAAVALRDVERLDVPSHPSRPTIAEALERRQDAELRQDQARHAAIRARIANAQAAQR